MIFVKKDKKNRALFVSFVMILDYAFRYPSVICIEKMG